ncbi:MAG: hypothetical protein B6I24_10490, partial [Bacteroidetes bacterium 4572_128]
SSKILIILNSKKKIFFKFVQNFNNFKFKKKIFQKKKIFSNSSKILIILNSKKKNFFKFVQNFNNFNFKKKNFFQIRPKF